MNDDGTITVGIPFHAQEQLGDLAVMAEDAVAVNESVKAASDIYGSAAGTVIAINEALSNSPELINDRFFEDGWVTTLQPENKDDLESMTTASD